MKKNIDIHDSGNTVEFCTYNFYPWICPAIQWTPQEYCLPKPTQPIKLILIMPLSFSLKILSRPPVEEKMLLWLKELWKRLHAQWMGTLNPTSNGTVKKLGERFLVENNTKQQKAVATLVLQVTLLVQQSISHSAWLSVSQCCSWDFALAEQVYKVKTVTPVPIIILTLFMLRMVFWVYDSQRRDLIFGKDLFTVTFVYWNGHKRH